MDLRALNRATLDRQLLLRRSGMDVPAALAHLVGLQAQTPHTWYAGLWSRLADFRAVDVATLLESRAVVRIALMRSTIHVIGAAEAAWIRPLVQPVLDRDLFANHTHGRWMRGLDTAAVAAHAHDLLAERAMTPAELGAALLRRWPDNNAAALAYAARNLLPLVQTPPRGVWGRSGRTVHAPLDVRADPPPYRMKIDDLVLRYLAAFGPATVADAQTWSGLTHLAEVVDRLRPRLRTFPGGYVDLPDAPRPDPDTLAPVRYLYDFDNLLLSYRDRTRVLTDEFRNRAVTRHGPVPRPVLVDGFTAGAWTVAAEVLTVRLFVPLIAADRDAVTAEGAALLGFLHPEAAPDVRLVEEVE
ncbi:winged helix DNA-binding domain-containing protein [Micromonospora sp. NPDC048835]|uniref:winged helix DNA-binding domain-containing protein n=1 Tax=Micromonospora sp. NPDC048835 TaxID=3155147 RepID=UPI0033EC2524